MNRYALGLLLLLAALFTACGAAEQMDMGNIPEEPSLSLREIDGVIEDWQGQVLTIVDGQGVARLFNTARAPVSGKCLPEPGCPVTVTLAAAGPADGALLVRVLAPPADLILARQLLQGMSLEEQAGQMLLARCPEENGAEQAEKLHLGGYVLFARDFAQRSPEQVRAEIAGYQQAARLPLFIAVDEEGGDVVRISCYAAFRDAPFAAPRELYQSGGLAALAADSREKGALLASLGVNVDLAPVADVSTSAGDFIYSRSLGQSAELTAQGVAAIVQGLEQGGVSATLKHFPGYGSNGDTHSLVVRDQRPAAVFFEQDLLPFRAGIQAGADLVLVSHNIVAAFDGRRPASLSPAVHRLLREELGFGGLIITDDLAMSGADQLYGVEETAVLAVLAGNDMLLSSAPEEQLRAVLAAVEQGRIDEALIRQAAERILRAKIRAGLIPLAEGAGE